MTDLSHTPSAAYDDPDALPVTQEARLELTQGMRVKLLNALVKDGTIPTDQDGAKLVLAVLDSMDKTTLGAMRQKTDDKSAQADQIVAQALLTLGQKIGTGSTLRITDPCARAKHVHVDDSQLPDIDLVPGELDTGTHAISYNELAGKFARGQVAQLEHNPED